MTITFQLVIFALIMTSSILLISIPIVFASSDSWSSNKNVIFFDTSLWIGLVFLVAILNSLISETSLVFSRFKNIIPSKKSKKLEL